MSDKKKSVRVWLMATSEPLDYEDVENTYTKGGVYCLYLGGRDERVVKYPLCTIFRIEEEYGTHGTK